MYFVMNRFTNINTLLQHHKTYQTLVHIFNLMHSHLARVWFSQSFSRYDFQKPHKIFSIGQVGKEIVDLERIKYRYSELISIQL